MGSIVTIASAKGGCGKSALAAMLAVNLATKAYKVAVLDADPNRGFAEWHSATYEGPPLTVDAESSHLEIVDRAQALADTHDVVLVDTAGFSNQCSAMAMGTADLVLVPVLPDRQSVLEGMKAAKQVANFAKASRREIPCRVVLSRWTPRGLVERSLSEDLVAAGLVTLRQHLSDLSDFRKFTVSGVVPVLGRVGEQAQNIIDELAHMGVLPTARVREAA